MLNNELTINNQLDKVEEMFLEELDKFQVPITWECPDIESSESSLDAWDYCFALAIGLCGMYIATNKQLSVYLDGIHKAASDVEGDYDLFQSFLGTSLHHKGDYIDSLNGTFKNRNGENAYGLFHRLLWGHDVFSIDKDNPFKLMLEQHKGLSGILQAIRHLLADTTSKQGLPLPGSSFLDYKKENGNISNYLISIAQNLSEEAFGNKANAQEIYAHMMAIRAQDVTAGIVVKLISELYFKIRKIEDKIRCAEIQLIAYAVNFFGEAITGMIRQNGVPYINIPLALATVSAFTRFCYWNNIEIKELAQKTNEIHSNVMLLENEEQFLSSLIEDKSDGTYISSLEDAENNYNDVLSFLKEETE